MKHIAWLLTITMIIGCGNGGKTPTPKLSGSDTTKPIATYWLMRYNLSTGPYLKDNGGYSAESDTIETAQGNKLKYKVSGTHTGQATKIELTIEIHNIIELHPTKLHLIEIMSAILLQVTRGKDVSEQTLSLIKAHVYSETLTYRSDRTNTVSTIERFSWPPELTWNTALRNTTVIEHTLINKSWEISPGIQLTVERETLTEPHEWGDPFIIRITIHP